MINPVSVAGLLLLLLLTVSPHTVHRKQMFDWILFLLWIRFIPLTPALRHVASSTYPELCSFFYIASLWRRLAAYSVSLEEVSSI